MPKDHPHIECLQWICKFMKWIENIWFTMFHLPPMPWYDFQILQLQSALIKFYTSAIQSITFYKYQKLINLYWNVQNPFTIHFWAPLNHILSNRTCDIQIIWFEFHVYAMYIWMSASFSLNKWKCHCKYFTKYNHIYKDLRFTDNNEAQQYQGKNIIVAKLFIVFREWK